MRDCPTDLFCLHFKPRDSFNAIMTFFGGLFTLATPAHSEPIRTLNLRYFTEDPNRFVWEWHIILGGVR